MHDAIDPRHRNRGIDEFNETECWSMFRYRKIDLKKLVIILVIPIPGDKNGTVNGDSAFLLCQNVECALNDRS